MCSYTHSQLNVCFIINTIPIIILGIYSTFVYPSSQAFFTFLIAKNYPLATLQYTTQKSTNMQLSPCISYLLSIHHYNYNYYVHCIYVYIPYSGYIFHLSILHIPNSTQYYQKIPTAFQYNLEGSTIRMQLNVCIIITYTSLLLASFVYLPS